MNLTPAEFCSFNLKSRIQLLMKDGVFLAERRVYRAYKVRLFKVYQFYTEMVLDLAKNEVISITPVINSEVLRMYRL